MSNLLLIPKWISLLLALYEHEQREGEVRQVKLKRQTSMTHSHLVNLLLLFEERGLLNRRHEGRDNYVSLTLRGRRVCMLLHSTNQILYEKNSGGLIRMEQKEYRKKKQIGIIGSPTCSDGTGKAIFSDSPEIGQKVIVMDEFRKKMLLCELSNPKSFDPSYAPGGMNFMRAVAGIQPIQTNTCYFVADYRVIGELVEGILTERRLGFPLTPRSEIYEVD